MQIPEEFVNFVDRFYDMPPTASSLEDWIDFKLSGLKPKNRVIIYNFLIDLLNGGSTPEQVLSAWKAGSAVFMFEAPKDAVVFLIGVRDRLRLLI